MNISLPYNWDPRPYQRNLWSYLNNGGKRAVACWHRRAGKDEVCLHHTACAAHETVANYWHMLPEYAQARKAIWDAVNKRTSKRRIDEAFPVELRESTNDQEMKIKFKNGSTWQVVGSDNYASLVGSGVAGIVFSEFAKANPSAWGYLSPILKENDGWALFISTPEGHNHFENLLHGAQKRDGWFGELLTNDDTHIFSDDGLREELETLVDLHGQDYAKSVWMQEYFCSFDAAIPGSIWGDCVQAAEDSGRVVDFEIDTTIPVHTAYDLGRTDDSVIWWYQISGKRIDVIDHASGAGWDIHNELIPDKSIVHLLKSRQAQHKITYADHHLPHDARPRTLAAGGKSIYQQLHGWANIDPTLGRFMIGKCLDKQEHIQAGRATFKHCRFHKTRTAKGLKSLKAYHREWDDEKKVFSTTPKHDWASHDADGFMELSTSWKLPTQQQEQSALDDYAKLLSKNPCALKFGDLKEQHFRNRRREREAA